MPIEVTCASCSGHFRLPDSAGGKKIRCPKCKGPIEVPAAEPPSPPTGTPTEVFVPPPVPKAPPQPAFVPPPLPKKQSVFVPPPAVSEPPPLPPTPAAEWHFKTETGEEYGPVGRDELDEWFREGRITADCQIRSAAADEWQRAAEVYPQLSAPPEARVQGSGFRVPESKASSPPVEELLPPAAAVETPQVSFPQPAKKATAPRTKRTAAAADDETDCSQRSRLVSGFLGIFLGPLGIHRFYLGYWGVGLAMLATAGGCGLWSLIDAVFVMTGRVPDADGRPLSP